MKKLILAALMLISTASAINSRESDDYVPRSSYTQTTYSGAWNTSTAWFSVQTQYGNPSYSYGGSTWWYPSQTYYSWGNGVSAWTNTNGSTTFSIPKRHRDDD